MIAAADVRAKLAFLEKATRLHHRGFAVSRARYHTSCQVVTRDYTPDCLGKVFTFGRTLGLGIVQREGDHFPPRGDERDG